jgi:guanylate kinase
VTKEFNKSSLQIIIVAAPSGAGKSSFVDRLTAEDQRIHDVITYTTRPMRHHEKPGKPYYFISKADFDLKVKNNFFVEWAQVHTNYYGTSFEELEGAWKLGRVAIMDIDIQGMQTYKSKFDRVKTVFILPPSIDELKRRVIARDGVPPVDLDIRMENAQKEMLMANQFDVQIVNDDFERSFAEFKKIVEKWITTE